LATAPYFQKLFVRVGVPFAFTGAGGWMSGAGFLKLIEFKNAVIAGSYACVFVRMRAFTIRP
jgi:hypothetical protein